MIEIIETRLLTDTRAVDIVISNAGQFFFYRVGGLPLVGDLQAILDAQEAELWPLAQAAGLTPANLYSLQPERVLKAFALVVLDEINILRQRAGLALRTASQIDDAIKNKLKAM